MISYVVAVDMFAAIAEPNRRRILEFLSAGERGAGEIAAVLPGLTQPAISRHLRILRESGLVRVRPVAQRRIYVLEPAGLQGVDAWLDRYRAFWAGGLDRLGSYLSTEPER